MDTGYEFDDSEGEMSVTLRPARARPVIGGGPDEVVLTPKGYAKLEEEHRLLTTVRRPEAEARLSEALRVAGDLADNAEYVDARAELDLVENRIALLERRLHAARLLRPDEPSSRVVSLGSHVTLEDVDEGVREEYVIVSSVESNPAEGRLSIESPVGRAVVGHLAGEVVDAHAPHGIRHIRIAELTGASSEIRRNGSEAHGSGR